MRQPQGCDVREDLPPGSLPEGAGSQLLGRFLENVPLGVYACDAGGRISFCNPQAVRLWGRTPQEGETEAALFAALHAESAGASAGASDPGRELSYQQPGGRRVTVLLVANAVRDPAGVLVGSISAMVDLTGQKAVEQALLQRERELSEFFESAMVGLRWMAEDGTILRANRYELDMLGYAPHEYLGHNIREFHEDPAGADRLLERLRAGEEVHNCEARLRSKDGSFRDVLVNSSVLSEQGRFIHARCFTRDITPFRRAGEAMVASDRRKTEFLSVLAQALRSPLSTIRSVVGFLGMGGRTDAERQSAQEVCDRQLAHLIGLVDDLADVARIAGGTLHLRKEEVSLAEVLGNAVEAARPAVEQAGQVLRLSLPEAPVPLEGDPPRLVQVFQNLLDNAARYSAPGGTITVSADIEPGGENPQCVCIRVADTGMGIGHERLPHLFDIFSQGDAAGRRPGEGLGIGLAIARAIVEKHGGRLEVRSDGHGAGSEFRVYLPAAAAAARPAPGARRRVLVVDDNEDSAVIMSMLLNYMGHETRTAFAGHAALAAAAEYRPDAVLMDIGLPELDGYEVCRRIRSQPWGRDMMLVAVTGWGHQDDKQRARAAGFDDHLTKPADLDELRRVLAG